MWWSFFPIPFPYFDEYHTHKKPYITVILLWVNFIIFGATLVLSAALNDFSFTDMFRNLAVVPADIVSGENLYTLITYLFVHTGVLHFLGNMWFLYIFGDNVEHNMGRVNFFLFFIISGVLSALAHVYLVAGQSLTPLVGASGAISGILGAYIVLLPENKIHVVFGPKAKFQFPAFWYIWIWFVLQAAYLFLYTTESTAFMSHIAGFASGVILAYIFGKKIKYKNYRFETPDYLDTI
ncbi:MAG: rhomboid family intramembrane serine protease [Candidatus Spechtbacterales bacterium]